jgi:hypothetical protein
MKQPRLPDETLSDNPVPFRLEMAVHASLNPDWVRTLAAELRPDIRDLITASRVYREAHHSGDSARIRAVWSRLVSSVAHVSVLLRSWELLDHDLNALDLLDVAPTHAELVRSAYALFSVIRDPQASGAQWEAARHRLIDAALAV